MQRLPQNNPINKQPNKKKSIPDTIARAKELRKDLYTQIALIHNDLFELGEANDAKTVKNRKTLLDKRKPLIQKHELIYPLIEEFFITRIIPDGIMLFLNENQNFTVEEKTTDFSTLSDIELVNAKNRLQKRISKQRSILQYQSVVSKPQPCPMPAGIKRKDAEQKLEKLTDDYNIVCNLLKNRR